MAVTHLSDGNEDGCTFGQDSSDKISFFGATTVAKLAALPADATDATTAIALANAIKARLVSYGLCS